MILIMSLKASVLLDSSRFWHSSDYRFDMYSPPKHWQSKHYPALDRLSQMAVAPPAADPIMLKTAGEQLEKHGKGVDPA